jgi:hypothetical protein
MLRNDPCAFVLHCLTCADSVGRAISRDTDAVVMSHYHIFLTNRHKREAISVSTLQIRLRTVDFLCIRVLIGRFDILLRHERHWSFAPASLMRRTIHGSTDCSKIYSKGMKTDGGKPAHLDLPQPSPFLNPTSQTPSQKASSTPSVDPLHQYYSFKIASASSGMCAASSVTPALTQTIRRSSEDSSANMLDPQLLSMGPSSGHMLSAPFSSDDDTYIPVSMEESPESLPGASPFCWKDFTFFDELNHSLGILNPTDDIQAQLNQLMDTVVPSGTATTWPSTPTEPPDTPVVPEPPSCLFRIPKSHEVLIKGIHSAPPPIRNVATKLNEPSWQKFADHLKETALVCPV